jgi:hypothetical protein
MQLFFFDFFDYLESSIFMVKVFPSLRHGASSCGGQRRQPADIEGRCEYTEKEGYGVSSRMGELEEPYIKKQRLDAFS